MVLETPILILSLILHHFNPRYRNPVQIKMLLFYLGAGKVWVWHVLWSSDLGQWFVLFFLNVFIPPLSWRPCPIWTTAPGCWDSCSGLSNPTGRHLLWWRLKKEALRIAYLQSGCHKRPTNGKWSRPLEESPVRWIPDPWKVWSAEGTKVGEGVHGGPPGVSQMWPQPWAKKIWRYAIVLVWPGSRTPLTAETFLNPEASMPICLGTQRDCFGTNPIHGKRWFWCGWYGGVLELDLCLQETEVYNDHCYRWCYDFHNLWWCWQWEVEEHGWATLRFFGPFAALINCCENVIGHLLEQTLNIKGKILHLGFHIRL